MKKKMMKILEKKFQVVKFLYALIFSPFFKIINFPMFVINSIIGLSMLFWGGFALSFARWKFLALSVCLALTLLIVLSFPYLGWSIGKIALWSLLLLPALIIFFTVFGWIIVAVLFLIMKKTLWTDEFMAIRNSTRELIQSITIWIGLAIFLVL